MRSKIAEIQADRKNVIRQVGETLCRIWREVEEGTISESRAGAFRRRFSGHVRAVQNRLLVRRRRQRRLISFSSITSCSEIS